MLKALHTTILIEIIFNKYMDVFLTVTSVSLFSGGSSLVIESAVFFTFPVNK